MAPGTEKRRQRKQCCGHRVCLRKKEETMSRRIVNRVMAAVLLTACILCGCGHSSKSLTFQVQTGDAVKVTLETTEGYRLSEEEGTVVVKKEEEQILQGAFLTREMYDENVTMMQSMEGVTVTEGQQDGNSYLFYEYDGDTGYENGYVLMVAGSDTGVFLAGNSPKEDAEKAFAALHFEKSE